MGGNKTAGSSTGFKDTSLIFFCSQGIGIGIAANLVTSMTCANRYIVMHL